MVKKSVALCFIIISVLLVVLLSFVKAQAQTSEEEKVAKAYDWLIKQVKGKWHTLNVKQHVFSLLALNCNESYFKPGNASLYGKSFSNAAMRCWGAGPAKATTPESCLLTETALGKIALDTWRDNSTKVDKWLLSRNKTETVGINWYLQIDVEKGYNASCEIIYGGNEEAMFEVAADKKVSITGSSKCFYVDTTQPYWFAIRATPDCYSYRYTIKCWSNATLYRANLLYRKTGSAAWHVSSETQSGKPGVPGSTRIEDQPNPLELQVQSYCLTNPISTGYCDYEGTAWTAYAFARMNDARANMFVPYLIVFAEENTRFFPESFLYPITKQERYSSQTIAAQKIVGTDKGYWLIQPIVYGRVYDTAHAGLALGAAGEDSIIKAKNYLLAGQEANGNLVSIGYGEAGKEPVRDTAFALWVFWAGLCPGIGIGWGARCLDMGPDYICTSEMTCEPGWLPVPDLECDFGELCCKLAAIGEVECTEAGGYCKESSCNESEIDLEETLGIICPDFMFCCKPYSEAYCDEAKGEICDILNGYSCSGREVETLDGTCCLGSCVPNNTGELNCLDIGVPCDIGEVCINRITWEEIGFTETKDSDTCCVGSSVKCVPDRLCSSIGEVCGPGESCEGNIVETKDEEECCEGRCLESCSKKGGVYCSDPSHKCSGGYFVTSSEGPRCCINGQCKKPASLWWIWIIIIVIIIAGLYYYLQTKKKKAPKEEKPMFGFPPLTRPVIRPMPTRPGLAMTTERRAQPTPTKMLPKLMPRPLQQPTPMQPARGLPSRLPSKPMPLRAAPKAPAPTPKPKGKTESELEKTLSKLKKMTKK